MAKDSLVAAIILEREELLRPSASRFYYAAFQASIAVLLYLRLTPPTDEEGWSHITTPSLLREHLEPVIESLDKRRRIAGILQELYKLRIEADYIGDCAFDLEKSKDSAKNAKHLVKTMEDILQ